MPDAFDRLVADMKRIKGRARVGALDDRNAAVLSFSEFGTVNEPPRPTLSAAFDQAQAAMRRAIDRKIGAVIDGRRFSRHIARHRHGNVSPTGGSASAFQSMRLGPASLTKGKSEWSGNPADAFLDTTAPGQLYLYLRSKYVMSIFCS